MRFARGMLFASLTLGALAFTPRAQADSWQKSSDGYWYYWCDDDQTWYYVDGENWLVEDEGQWVPCGYVTGADGSCYYYANRDYCGWRRGGDGSWRWHHHPRVGRYRSAYYGYHRGGLNHGGYRSGYHGHGGQGGHAGGGYHGGGHAGGGHGGGGHGGGGHGGGRR